MNDFNLCSLLLKSVPSFIYFLLKVGWWNRKTYNHLNNIIYGELVTKYHSIENVIRLVNIFGGKLLNVFLKLIWCCYFSETLWNYLHEVGTWLDKFYNQANTTNCHQCVSRTISNRYLHNNFETLCGNLTADWQFRWHLLHFIWI